MTPPKAATRHDPARRHARAPYRSGAARALAVEGQRIMSSKDVASRLSDLKHWFDHWLAPLQRDIAQALDAFGQRLGVEAFGGAPIEAIDATLKADVLRIVAPTTPGATARVIPITLASSSGER